MKAALTEVQIKNLEEKGFSRWTKGDYDRLYINAGKLVLECGYYNTGNIRSASFDGESISNSRARRMKAAKTFVDVRTGRVYSDDDLLREAAADLVYDAVNEQ